MIKYDHKLEAIANNNSNRVMWDILEIPCCLPYTKDRMERILIGMHKGGFKYMRRKFDRYFADDYELASQVESELNQAAKLNADELRIAGNLNWNKESW